MITKWRVLSIEQKLSSLIGSDEFAKLIKKFEEFELKSKQFLTEGGLNDKFKYLERKFCEKIE